MRSKRRVTAYIIATIIFILFVYFVYRFRVKIGRIVVPFIIAGVISYILHPVVIKMERKNISRSVSIIIIYAILGVFLVTTTIFIIPQLISNTKELINALPQITQVYKDNFDSMVNLIHSSKWPADVKSAIFKELYNATDVAENIILDTLRNALSGFIKAAAGMLDMVLAMMIAYYLLKDSEFFKNAALSLVPRRWGNGIIATGREINGILSDFIQGQLLTAIIVGVMETIALYIIGIKYPLFLGLIGGIANTIPYFGPIIAAIPAVAVAIIQSPEKALWTITAFVIIQQIDNTFISPKIIDNRIGLHPVTTILAVLAGGEFFGILGMLVAVPVTAVIKVILKRVIEAIV